MYILDNMNGEGIYVPIGPNKDKKNTNQGVRGERKSREVGGELRMIYPLCKLRRVVLSRDFRGLKLHLYLIWAP